MTTAEQNAKAVEFAARAAAIRQKYIDYQAASGSARAPLVTQAAADLAQLEADQSVVLGDMQQTS